MTHTDNRTAAGLLILAAVLPASGAFAQAAPVPQEAPRTIPGLVTGTPPPAPTQTPVPVPTDAVRGLSLPTPAATPRTAASPRPSATRVPTRTRDAAPAERAIAPAPSPIPTPEAQPVPAPSPTADRPQPVVPVETPPAVAPQVSPTPGAAPIASVSAFSWRWIGPALVALLALIGWFWFRRRRSGDDAMIVTDPSPPRAEPAQAAVAEASPIVPAGPRARIEIALQPSRAGLNMLSAVVEAVVVVTNRGDAPAGDVRIHPTLLSAHAGQDADLAAAFAAPIGRPATPPFTLQPGEERRVRIVAALPRDGVRSMEAGGRPMFVPLLAIDVRYVADAAGTAGRTGRAFVVGIERVDSAKLAPFWLDAPLKMHDQIGARGQGAVLAE